MVKKSTIELLGATGSVGQRIITLIENNPWLKLDKVCASERSAGKRYKNSVDWVQSTEIPEEIANMSVESPDPKKSDADIVLSALPSDIAKNLELEYATEGLVVSSNASSHRMEPDIPLLIPELNASHLELIEIQKENRKWDGFIVTNPNCSTIGLAIPLKPLHESFQLKTVYVTTMQAASGAGLPGVPSLKILDNVVPYIESEEEKVQTESLKILGKFIDRIIEPASFKIFASCNRVPVIDGHMESVFATLKSDITIDKVADALRNFRGLIQHQDLPTRPKDLIIVRSEKDRPQTRLDRDAGSVRGMAVTVGRLRGWSKNTIGFSALSHNTLRGAAGAAILNAELLKAKNMI